MLVVAIATGCSSRQLAPTLPSESELEPDRLMLFVHGYMNDHETMEEMVAVFTQEGVGHEEGVEAVPVHGHVFDYGLFTRAGAGNNQSMEDLVDGFSEFYHSLPDRCPVCRRRANRPVEVTIVAHSLGGVMIRDFLLSEAQRIDPGEHEWRVSQVVTMGSPFFGSSLTRLTQGFLSIVVNLLVRTLVLGFVNPERGGTFGNTLDPQARALRLGSPYLWDSHARWMRHLEAEGDSMPSWLHVVAIGAAGARGDGVSRIPSTNIAPLMPEGAVETLLVNFRHSSLARIKERGRSAREQQVMMRAIAAFMDEGTLTLEPWLEPRLIVDTGQTLFVQRVDEDDEEEARDDLRRKLDRLDHAVESDVADIWMRFYELAPDPVSGYGTQAVLLKAPSSFFRTGVERSPNWLDLSSESPELSSDGEMIPVVSSLDFQHSQLISIPEITPTGAYRMHIRLSHGVIPSSEHVTIIAEGVGRDDEPAPDGRPGVPFRIRPMQANLLHVMLDGAAIRAAHPELRDLDIREVALIPED